MGVPCARKWELWVSPCPRTMYEWMPINPGTIPSSHIRALIAPGRRAQGRVRVGDAVASTRVRKASAGRCLGGRDHSSAVTGSIIRRTSVTTEAGNPLRSACSWMSASSSAR